MPEALASLTTAYDFDNEIERHDETAISLIEAGLERKGISDTAWVRELVTAARDPPR